MPELEGFHHVKLPVSDLAASRRWYEGVLGLQVEKEFSEDGLVRGVVMRDADNTINFALRQDADRARGLSGFDAVALRVPTRDAVSVWRVHLDSLGEDHGGIVTGSGGGAVLVGLHDPDGIEIRLYAD